MNASPGFTLVELMLSMALLTILTMLGSPVYESLARTNNLATAKLEIVQSIHRAQLLSRGSDGDSAWGVNLATGAITLFKGANFAGRDTNYDEVTSIASTINFSGLTEIDFTKFTGDPTASGTITLTGPNAESQSLTLNTKGTVDY